MGDLECSGACLSQTWPGGGQGTLRDNQLQARLCLELLGAELPGSPLVDRLRVPPT